MAFQKPLRVASVLTFLLSFSYPILAQNSSSASSSAASSASSSATSTAAFSTSSSAPTTAAGKNAKRGLSYPDSDNIADILNINQTNSLISWQYDWGITPPPNLAQSGVQYVPMQWGSGGIENLSDAVTAQGAQILLTFNEPDFNEQSNIDPNDAAQLWMEYIEPLKSKGVRLGGPAVSSGSTGVPWLTSFFAACSNCTIDFIPIHWYGEGVEGFYSYLFQIYSQFGNRTIWVTEYADTSLNDTEVLTFLNQTMDYMDTLDFVERYAWFGYFRPENGSAYNMMNNDGSLNTLGELYIGADTVETSGPATNTAAGIPVGGAGPTQTLGTVSVGPDQVPTILPSSAGRTNIWDSHTWGLVGMIGWVMWMWL